MSKKKKFKKNNRKRNFLIQSFILLFLFIGIGYATLSVTLNIGGSLGISKKVCIPDGTLYSILECASKNNDLAKNYTGNHRDSYTNEPSKPVYHWYATNYSQGTEINNRYNVLFADQCWQMIRTTDTGGVRLFYNGAAENNQCLDTRGSQIGYRGISVMTLSNNYYYGTSYSYENNVFSLSETVTTGSISIGQYTCLSNSIDGTCENLYLVESLQSENQYNVIKISSSVTNGSIGMVPYNRDSSALSSVGYMYGSSVPASYRDYSIEKTFYQYLGLFQNNSYWVSDEIYWNTSTNQYELINPYQVSYENSSSMQGKYTYMKTDSSYSNNKVYYVKNVNGSTATSIELSYGDDRITFGDHYENNEGVYSIPNGETISVYDLYENLDNVLNKYVCIGSLNNYCRKLYFFQYSSGTIYYLVPSNNFFKFSNGFTFSNGVYTLNDVSVFDHLTANSHYTCWNQSGTCSNISYVFNTYTNTTGKVAYYSLSNGEGIDDMLLNSFENNVKDSIAKFAIEKWYEKYLSSYHFYLDNSAIFCNDRSFVNDNIFNANGGDVHFNSFVYSAYSNGGTESSLSCDATDQFSAENPSATLMYPIGLMSLAEVRLLSNPNALKAKSLTILMSPRSYMLDYGNYFSTLFQLCPNGTVTCYIQDLDLDLQNASSIRPAISLSQGIRYASGDGSKESPYTIS